MRGHINKYNILGMGKRLKQIASIALPIAGSFIPGLGTGVGAALGGALGGAIKGGGLKGALLGGATSFAGSALGNALAPSIASAGLKGTIGGTLGKTAANALGSTISNTALSNIAGNVAGNYITDSAADALIDDEVDGKGIKKPAEEVFQAKRQDPISLPGSLTGLQGQDEMQQSSNLATQGVYGGGLGADEQGYFQNLINRRLVDDAGNVDADLSEVNPIEQSYLEQLGLGGYKDSQSLLKAMSKWKAT